MIGCTFNYFGSKQVIFHETKEELDKFREELAYLGCTDVRFTLSCSDRSVTIPVKDNQGNEYSIKCSCSDIPRLLELFPDVHLNT